jgi:hypothetical protein
MRSIINVHCDPTVGDDEGQSKRAGCAGVPERAGAAVKGPLDTPEV